MNVNCSPVYVCVQMHHLYDRSCTFFKKKNSFYKKKTKTFTQTGRSIAWKLIPFSGTLSRRGLHPINLAYDHMSAEWPAQLSASACNRLGQYASSPDNRAYCYAELAVSSPCSLIKQINSEQDTTRDNC